MLIDFTRFTLVWLVASSSGLSVAGQSPTNEKTLQLDGLTGF
jgi:hypothetical protein